MNDFDSFVQIITLIVVSLTLALLMLWVQDLKRLDAQLQSGDFVIETIEELPCPPHTPCVDIAKHQYNVRIVSGNLEGVAAATSTP